MNIFTYIALTASVALGLWLAVWFVQDWRAERRHRKRKRMATIYPSPFLAQWGRRDRLLRPNVRR